MKIGIIAPLAERVPPKKYGGTERVIDQQIKGLIKRGHRVTLFASGDSQTDAKLFSVIQQPLRESKNKDIYGTNLPSLVNMGEAYARQDEFDIIHDHNPLVSLPTANIARIPVVMTWHNSFTPEIVDYFSRFKNPHLISISQSQQTPAPDLNFIGNVYHGMDMEDYPFSETTDKYLLFVGRFSPEKGAYSAIRIAKKLKLPLVIAAKLDTAIEKDMAYFYKYIKPSLGGMIRWVGEVDEKRRNKLMSRALAFLHPISWPEPFGLALIESMVCGTPVVAMGHGSIPEIIQHGRTGFVSSNIKDMVWGVKNINKIIRKYCREYVLQHFTQERMAGDYEAIYQQVIAREKIKNQVTNHEESSFRQKLLLGFGPSNS